MNKERKEFAAVGQNPAAVFFLLSVTEKPAEEYNANEKPSERPLQRR